MDTLKLGLLGLPESEARLVATLFRLHGVDRSFIWSLASDGPFDAVLVEAVVPEAEWRAAVGDSVPVRRLLAVGVPSAGADEMARPIRSDRLVDWLNSVEVQILHGGGDGFVSTSFQAGQASVLPLAGRPSSPVYLSTARPGLSSNRFKLKRWPPPALLAADVVRIRAATLLSRRAMSLEELSEVSKMTLQRCEAFVLELSGLGLLDTAKRALKPAAVREALPKGAGEAPAGTKNGFGRGLISSIRRRFSMG